MRLPLANEHHRRFGDPDQVLGDAADEQTLAAASAVGADHDQVGTPVALVASRMPVPVADSKFNV